MSKPPRPATASPRDYLSRNRQLWEKQSDSYDRRCASVLEGPRAEAWGLWRIPESTLDLLGPVRGKSVLELGCGAARWSIALAGRGARVVGLDLSNSQLGKARALRTVAKARGPELLRGNVERLPFADASFDLAFSDWGGLTFADPRRTIPEAARVLRPGGLLVFATSSPFRAIAQHRRTDRTGPRLLYDYFGLHRIDYPNEVNFVLGYSDWVDLFGRSGFAIERLVEARAPARKSRYLSASDQAWAKRWPMELLWKVRQDGRPVPRLGRGGRNRTRG